MTLPERLQAAWVAATPGEWVVAYDRDNNTQLELRPPSDYGPHIENIGDSDAEFIALAHNSMPRLLALVAAAEAYKAACDVDDATHPTDEDWEANIARAGLRRAELFSALVILEQP